MFKRMKPELILVFIVTLGMFAGCAPKEKEFVYYSWPTPPVEPRIVYIGSYYGEIDYQQLGFFDKLFGAKPGSVLQQPYGVTAIGNKIYVSETHGKRVAVIDPDNRKVTYIGDLGKTRIVQPFGLAGGPDGLLYVADGGRNAIIVYDQTGKQKKVIGGKDVLLNPVGVAFNSALDRLYVVDSKLHQIKVFSPGGESLRDIGRRGAGDGEFNFPTGIVVNRKNNDLYIVDSQNHRVQVLDQDGKFIRKFGEAGDQPGAFMLPKSIALDSDGQVYVIDTLGNSFQVLDELGVPQVRYGGLGVGPGEFSNPASIFIDEGNRIYITDAQNYRVQVFQSMTERWKKEHPEELRKYLKHWEDELARINAESGSSSP